MTVQQVEQHMLITAIAAFIAYFIGWYAFEWLGFILIASSVYIAGEGWVHVAYRLRYGDFSSRALSRDLVVPAIIAGWLVPIIGSAFIDFIPNQVGVWWL